MRLDFLKEEIITTIINASLIRAKELFDAAWLLHFYTEININMTHYLRVALYNTGAYIKKDDANRLWLVKMYNKKTSFSNDGEEWYRLSDEQIKTLLIKFNYEQY